MADPATWIAIIGAVGSIAGGTYAAISSYQQGKTANAIAQYNAHQQEVEAKMQLMSMQAQAELQKKQANANFAFRQLEANARFANAKAIENTVEGQSRNMRETIRRK